MAPNRGHALFLLCSGVLSEAKFSFSALVSHAGSSGKVSDTSTILCSYNCGEECGEKDDNYYDRDEKNSEICLRNTHRRGEEQYLLGGMYCSHALGGGMIHDETTCRSFKARDISKQSKGQLSILSTLGVKAPQIARPKGCRAKREHCPGNVTEVVECPSGMWSIQRGQVNTSNSSCCSSCPGGSSMCYDDCSCMCSDARYCWQITDEKLCGNEGPNPLAEPFICGTSPVPDSRQSRCCWDASTSSCKEAPKSGGLEKFDWFTFYVDWSNETGCTVNADPPEYLTIGDKSLKTVSTQLCLHNSESVVAVFFFAGVLCGLAMAWCSLNYGKHDMGARARAHATICSCLLKDDGDYKRITHQESKFAVGAKLMATKALVSGGGKLFNTLLFRTCQLCANACMPMMLMIYLDPPLVLFLWFVFYALPGYKRVGKDLFHQTFYAVTPPKVSFFGMNIRPEDHPEDEIFWFFFSAIRTVMYPGFVLLIGYLIYKYWDVVENDDNPGQYVVNTSLFFRAGYMKGEGGMVRDVVMVFILGGTFLHSILTFLLLLDYRCGGKWVPPISFRHHQEDLLLEDAVEAVQQVLVGYADELRYLQKTGGDVKAEWEAIYIDEVPDYKYPAETTTKLQNECQKACDDVYGFTDDEEERVRTLSKIRPFNCFNLTLTILIGLATFFGFCYKCFLLVYAGRSLTAFFLVTFTSQSIFMFIFTGVATRGAKAFNEVLATGILHVDYVYLTAWLKGLGGLPYLMVTLYTLPTANLSKWYNNFLVPAFLLKGIIGMAIVLIDNIDYDLFAVELAEGSVLRDISTLAGCSAEEEQEEDSEFLSDLQSEVDEDVEGS